MLHHVRANLWLLMLSLAICCVVYPLVLLAIGQVVFPTAANGSLIVDRNGQTIGSRLIAQPFTGDQYFQPRPSAASYNGAVSGSSSLGASNNQLRDRVAQALGPIVKYAAGPKKGQPVGPDVERWFAEQDRIKAKGSPGVLSRWADKHPSAAQNWVKNADKSLSDYIADWQKNHPKQVAAWVKENSDTPEPQPADIAAAFFQNFSDEHPGKFPSAVDHPLPSGKTEKRIDLVGEGTDVQAVLFDMWLAVHPNAELQPVPADMVTTSGSGLDPDITLDNAHYQLDRVAAEWAKRTKRDESAVRNEVESMLNERTTAPLGGLVGVKLVNVLEINLALKDRYEAVTIK
jgi:potassium-transporting ATPase KdpC subunit